MPPFHSKSAISFKVDWSHFIEMGPTSPPAPPGKLLIDIEHKASRWHFVISSSFANSETIQRLSVLPRQNYTVFAVREDDTGNRFIEGFIRTFKRCRLSAVRKLIGPSIISVVYNVPQTIIDIHLQEETYEFGLAPAMKWWNFRNAILMIVFRSKGLSIFSLSIRPSLFPQKW